IKFVHTGLFKKWHGISDDIGNNVGVFHIRPRISSNHNCLRTELPGNLHGHARANTKASGFIAAGRNYSPSSRTTYQYGFFQQFAVEQPLYGYKKSVEIEM